MGAYITPIDVLLCPKLFSVALNDLIRFVEQNKILIVWAVIAVNKHLTDKRQGAWYPTSVNEGVREGASVKERL